MLLEVGDRMRNSCRETATCLAGLIQGLRNLVRRVLCVWQGAEQDDKAKIYYKSQKLQTCIWVRAIHWVTYTRNSLYTASISATTIANTCTRQSSFVYSVCEREGKPTKRHDRSLRRRPKQCKPLRRVKRKEIVRMNSSAAVYYKTPSTNTSKFKKVRSQNMTYVWLVLYFTFRRSQASSPENRQF